MAQGAAPVKPASRPPLANSPAAPTAGEDDAGSIRVNVRLVNVYATVTDSQGAPAAGLRKDDFRVLEDGVPQTISVFDRESELPLSIVLAVDTSGSTRRDMKLEMASAKKFARSIVRPVDRLTVYAFSETIDQSVRFTSDIKLIERAIDRLPAGAGTALYDAIYLSADALLGRQGRKVLVLITDGGDTTSSTKYSEALRRAQEAEAIIYSIIVVPVAADAGRDIGGEHALIQLSEDTGGKHFYAEGVEQLDEAFRHISEELRTQYLIAYYPSRRLSDSEFRRIDLQAVHKDAAGKPMNVRCRAGYYTAPAR